MYVFKISRENPPQNNVFRGLSPWQLDYGQDALNSVLLEPFIPLLAEVSQDEAKWNERRETSAGFRRVSYHACPRVSLTTSDLFVTCDTTQRTGLNLSASASGCWIWARPQILNGPIRVEDETTLRAAVVVDPITSLWGKPMRRIFRQIFRSLRAFRPAKHTYLEWNLLGFMKLLVFLLRFGTFLFEEKAICGATSGQRWMEWFPC